MTKKQAREIYSLEEVAYHKEMDKAALRIGTTNPEAMAWLIRFAHADLEAISQGELLNLAYELNRFVDSNFRTQLLPSLQTGFTLKDWQGQNRFPAGPPLLGPFIEPVETPPFRPPKMEFPNLETTKNHQTFVTDLLNQVLQNGWFGLWLPGVYLTIRTCPSPGFDMYGGSTVAETPEDSFKYNVAVLLTETCTRIRRCPECQRIFVADRKNKFSCSTRCQNTAAVRRMRQSLPKRTGKPGRPRGTTKAALKRGTPSPKRGKR